MRSSFDRRVVPEAVLRFVRACQRATACHLGGGAVLSGAWLGHRLSRDVDLFFHDPSELRRALATTVPAAAAEAGLRFALVRDGGTHVRGRLDVGERGMEVDLVYEAVPDIEPPPAPIEGVTVESEVDLRASKLTCLLSRSEPRDLVDLLFLDRAGLAPERDLPLALRKDGGIDPAVLAWLLESFPIRPLPVMLQPLSEEELRAFRDDLADRMRAAATPG